MSSSLWKVTFQVYRSKGSGKPHYDSFVLEIDPDEYVLDGVEHLWAFHDRSLCFRHLCHHSTCGACAMRVNGVEKLTCITPIREVTRDGGVLKIEPLRNFPVVSDLVVDMSEFYAQMEKAHYPQITPVTQAPLDGGIAPSEGHENVHLMRLNDCIECGCCISACPVATTTDTYLGPAVLAAIQYTGIKACPELASLADHEDGAWRCHSVYECSAVCPSFVEPAWRIMDLRKQIVTHRVKNLFRSKKEVAR